MGGLLMKSQQHEIATALLSIGAVELRPQDPFTWTSGIKSPIYCDNRLTMSSPTVRKQIAQALASNIQEYFPQTNIIAGTATAGIPHAAWVSDVLNLPMVYVRSKAKEHGRGNQIEGKIEAGQKVIVVANLKPVKLRGELSQGMILAGEKDGYLTLATVDEKLENGAKVK